MKSFLPMICLFLMASLMNEVMSQQLQFGEGESEGQVVLVPDAPDNQPETKDQFSLPPAVENEFSKTYDEFGRQVSKGYGVVARGTGSRVLSVSWTNFKIAVTLFVVGAVTGTMADIIQS